VKKYMRLDKNSCVYIKVLVEATFELTKSWQFVWGLLVWNLIVDWMFLKKNIEQKAE